MKAAIYIELYTEMSIQFFKKILEYLKYVETLKIFNNKEKHFKSFVSIL